MSLIHFFKTSGIEYNEGDEASTKHSQAISKKKFKTNQFSDTAKRIKQVKEEVKNFQDYLDYSLESLSELR